MKPYLQDSDFTLYNGDALEVLRTLPDESVHMCVTSPPFYGLRDYGTGTWEGGEPGPCPTCEGKELVETMASTRGHPDYMPCPECGGTGRATCDHVREIRKYVDGCVSCGAPMQDHTPGCGHCADRHAKRRKHGTPLGRNYETPPEDHWERERSRDQVTKTGEPYRDTCGKCGATRIDRQIGLEETPEQWVAKLVEVFREVRRVLRRGGTLWLEVGDSYVSSPQGNTDMSTSGLHGAQTSAKYAERLIAKNARETKPKLGRGKVANRATTSAHRPRLKPKDLIGAPWLLAFALRADGWYLRSDIVWSRPNPMPESVTDRPTKSHSYVFLLSRSARYFFDQEAVREPHDQPWRGNGERERNNWSVGGTEDSRGSKETVRQYNPSGRNIRSVWNIATQPYPEAHFATYPEELVRRCILAGTSERGCCPECGAPWVREVERGELVREAGARFSADEWDGEKRKGDHTTNSRGVGSLPPNHHYERIERGWHPSCECLGLDDVFLPPVPCTVLDPFSGSGTTALVARKHGRKCIGIELSADYCELSARRLQQLSLLSEAR